MDFLLQYDDGAQVRNIRPMMPYPGSDLYYYAIEKGLMRDCEDFYENKHKNSDLLAINFTDMSDDEFHPALCDANKVLLNNYFKSKQADSDKQLEEFYRGLDHNFRGIRQT